MSDVGIVVDLDDQTIEQSKIILDYTSRDYVAIRTQLVGLAKGFMPEWQTAGEAGDMGTLILELFAYMGDVMHFYIDRTASEAFLGTAVRRQSILYIADMMGYTPIGQQAASVALTLTLLADDPENPGSVVAVTLPAGTKFYNSAGNSDDVVIFELAGAVTLNPGDTTTVYADEGLTVQAASLGLCSGVPNTEFVIPDQGVIFGTVQITTREGYQVVDWTTQQHLSSARPTQAVFTTFLDEAGYTHIVFGDNSSGRIPPINAEVFVNYRYGRGSVANDLAANAIDTIAPVGDIDLYGLSVTNPDSPVGGSDPEDVDSMRYTISRGGTRIRDRAVTLLDYADLALQVPGVSKSVAYGTVYTAVHVRIAPPNGQANDDYMAKLRNAPLKAYMDDKIMIGSSVYAEPIHVDDLWQDVYIHVTVHVQDAYNRTTVRLQTDAVVRSLLTFNSVDFGYRVSVGALYRAILAVQGVSYAELEWLSTAAPVDDTDPEDGDTYTVLEATWQHDGSLTMADPNARHYRRNNATTPTAFALSTTDNDGITRSFASVHVGDHLVYRPALDVSSWMSFVVTTAPVNNTTWYQIGVTKIDQAVTVVAPGNNDKVIFSIIRYTPTPDSLSEVEDIVTDELLIPRIAPMPPILKATTINAAVATLNVATLTTAQAHGMLANNTIDVAGLTAPFAALNATNATIVSTPTPTTLTYAVTSAIIASAATTTGTITTVNLPESETDYPDLSEDERTHDGLWVRAVGGLPNT